MALLYTPDLPPLGMSAPDFSLPGVDGKKYSLQSFKDADVLLVVFMCNHCPYVKAVFDRLIQLPKTFAASKFAMIGINANDTVKYPDDSFEKMQSLSHELQFTFPYVLDETQETAKAYDAVCTPDPYLFKKDGDTFRLIYRGRIDDSWKDPALVKSKELEAAISRGLQEEYSSLKARSIEPMIPSMGCSLKWK
jgi:peroxiredoxin